MKNTWKPVTQAGRDFPQALTTDPKRVLLAFDFDGTLAPIVKNPQDVRMVEASADALAKLAHTGLQIASSSGLPVETIVGLADASNRPGLADAVIYGQYGAETLDMRTGHRHLPEPPEGIGAAKRALEELASKYPGARVEDKRQIGRASCRERV